MTKQPRRFIALAAEDRAYLDKMKAAIQRKRGFKLSLGNFVRMAVIALAKQEGVSK